jgi:hypothetical protein
MRQCFLEPLRLRRISVGPRGRCNLPRKPSVSAALFVLLAIAAVWLTPPAQAAASTIELVTNGGFETGDLTGWTTSGLGTSGTCPNANRDWNVASASSTGCIAVANPAGSTYAAYVMNDADGAVTYSLFQSVFVPVGTTEGTLLFDWTTDNFLDSNRLLNVLLDGTTVFSSTTFGSFGWTPVGIDVSAILAAAAGSSITLQFNNSIPAGWTGAAGLGLDNVSLASSAVPEPGTLMLLGVGLALVARRRSSQRA